MGFRQLHAPGFRQLFWVSVVSWDVHQGIPEGLKFMVGIALVDRLARMARQLHALFLGNAGIGQLAGETVPERMEGSAGNVPFASSLYGLEVQSCPSHDPLKALRESMTSARALGRHARHNILCRLILGGQ